jgi:hypothetical protein
VVTRCLDGFVRSQEDACAVDTNILISQAHELHFCSSLFWVVKCPVLKPTQVETGIQFPVEPFKNVQVESGRNAQAVVVSLFHGSHILL